MFISELRSFGEKKNRRTVVAVFASKTRGLPPAATFHQNTLKGGEGKRRDRGKGLVQYANTRREHLVPVACRNQKKGGKGRNKRILTRACRH